MKSDFENAIAPLDQSLADWVVVSGRGIKLFNNFVEHKSTALTVNDGTAATALGSCTLYKDVAGQVPMTNNDIASVTPKSVACVMTRKTVANSERAVGSNLYNRDQITKLITLVPAGSSDFTYTSQALRETQEYKKDQQGAGYDFNTLTGTTPIGSNAPGTISYVINGNIVTQATISGYMPARTNDTGTAITDREAWNVNYAVSTESGSVTKYTLSGNIDAMKNGASVGSVALRSSSFVRVSTANNQYRVVEAKLAVGVAAGSSTVDGVLYLNQFDTDKYNNRYLPTYLQFSGEFTNTNNESFKGLITAQVLNYKSVDSVAPLSAGNFVTGSASFSGSLKISERPALSVTFAARSTGYNTNEFNATYSDGSNFISFDGNNSLPYTLNIASATGVTVKWVDGAHFLDVFKNNSKVAALNLMTKTISYADGSFETFN